MEKMSQQPFQWLSEHGSVCYAHLMRLRMLCIQAAIGGVFPLSPGGTQVWTTVLRQPQSL